MLTNRDNVNDTLRHETAMNPVKNNICGEMLVRKYVPGDIALVTISIGNFAIISSPHRSPGIYVIIQVHVISWVLF